MTIAPSVIVGTMILISLVKPSEISPLKDEERPLETIGVAVTETVISPAIGSSSVGPSIAKND